MGSINPPIDEEIPANIPPPADPYQHVALVTQGNTANTLIKTMTKNMELIRVRLEQAESRTVQPLSGGWQNEGYGQGEQPYGGG